MTDGEHEFLDFNEKLSKLAKFAPHLWKDDVSISSFILFLTLQQSCATAFIIWMDNEAVIQFLCSVPSTDNISCNYLLIVFFSVQVSCNSSLVFTIFFRVKYYVENICLLQWVSKNKRFSLSLIKVFFF